MLLLRVFLLVMLIGGSRAEKDKKTIKNCDTMTCFVPKICNNEAAGDNSPLVQVGSIDEVFSDCNSIAKIRSYSTKYYLIVLESYQPFVISIQLKQGSTIFDCAKDAAGVVSAKYTYKLDADKKNVPMIESNAKPLLCKFFVRNDAGDVFADRGSTVDVMLSSTVNAFGSRMKGITFHSEIEPTCDPDAVQTAVRSDGDKTVSKVLVEFADLVCPAGQQLKYFKDGATGFESAGRISCPKNQFVIDAQTEPVILKEARCEVPTCTMCKNLEFPSPLKIMVEGDCSKLQCESGHRIKLASDPPIDGSVECKYVDPNHVWQINGKTITKDSSVTCAEKKTCDAEANEMCRIKDATYNRCDVLGGIPACPNSILMWKVMVVEDITCNDQTGQLEIKIQGEKGVFGKATVETLRCVDKGGKEKHFNESIAPAGASIGGGDSNGVMYGIVGAVIALLVVGAIVGFVVWRRSQQKKPAHPQFPITTKTDAKSVTSKESKSKESQKPSDPNKDTPKPNEGRPAQPVAGSDAPKGGDPMSPAEVALVDAHRESLKKKGKNVEEEQSAPEKDETMVQNPNGDFTTIKH